MFPGLQGHSAGKNFETQRGKLEYYLARIEQKFENGLEYQISNRTLEEIILVTIEIKEQLKNDDDNEIKSANYELRKKCSAALSLFEQPDYREIYIEKLHPIRSALRRLVSLL